MPNILYIDNQIVDLDSEISLPISYSIGDFKNPENRKRSVSKTIKVVGTQNNKNIFAGAYDLSLTDVGNAIGFDFNPNTKVKARYIRNGIEIFNGLVRLLNVEINKGNYTFEIVLFADFINIIKQMAEVNVNELDWSEYDHILNVSNVSNSWDTSVIKNGIATNNYTGTNPDGFGYWYPVVDYAYKQSSGTTLHTIDIENFVPYVYVKETFEKCFEKIGFTIDSDFFNETMIKALTWGFGGGAKESTPPVDVTQRRVNYDFDNSFVDTYNGYGTQSRYVTNVKRRYFLSQFADTLVNDGYAQYDATSNKITILRSGNYNLKLDYNSTVGYTHSGGVTGNLKIESRVIKNGVVVGSSTPLFFSTSTNYTQVTNTKLSLQAGDEVYMDFYVTGVLNGTTPFTANLNFNLNNDFNLDLTSENSFFVQGSIISLNRFIPNLKCSEFVKGVINMFNLYVSEPNEEGVIKIEPLQNYYEGEENWTELLDHSKPINIKPSVNDSAKKYNFKFAEDKDYFNQLYFDSVGDYYGNFTYESENEYSSDEIDYKLPFAQTIPHSIDKTYVLPKMVGSKDGGQTFEPFKGKPRIFFNNGLVSYSSWSIKDSSGLNTYNSYPQAHHAYGNILNPSFDLNFGKPSFTYYRFSNYSNNNLFNKYNRISIVEQTSADGKILTAYFDLDESTIGDFSALVNINGVLYRKNLITDYDANGYETTKVELYKVLETTEIGLSNPPIITSSPAYLSTGLVSSPKGVGQGTTILRGGKNSTLKQNPKILQL